MTSILHDLDADGMMHAIDDNAVGFYIYQGNSPLIHLDQSEVLVRVMSDIKFPIGNTIARSRFTGNKQAIQAEIANALNPFRSHDIPMAWIIGPYTEPPDLDGYLAEEGLFRSPNIPGMAAPIEDLKTIHPLEETIKIQRVKTESDLKLWSSVFDSVFGLPEFASKFWFDSLLSLGLDETNPLQHYIAVDKDEVVGTSSLLLWGGVAGIYNVATIQSMRNQGIGSALSLSPLQDAKTLGYQIGVLQSSDMAVGLYRKLGFKEYGQFVAYIWMGQPA